MKTIGEVELITAALHEDATLVPGGNESGATIGHGTLIACAGLALNILLCVLQGIIDENC